jgi:hypothetical protein
MERFKESLEAFNELRDEISVEVNSKLLLMIDRRIKKHFEDSARCKFNYFITKL